MNEYIKLAGTQGFVAIVSVILLPILSWGYDAEVVGQFALVQVTLVLLQTLIGQSLEQGMVRFYYKTKSKDSLVMTTFSYGFFCSVIFCLICYFTDVKVWSFFLNQDYVELNYQLCFLLFYINSFFILIARLENKGNTFFIISSVQRLFFLLTVLFLFWNGLTSGFNQLSSIFLCTLAVQFVVGFYLLKNLIKECYSARFNSFLFKELYVYSFPLFISALLSWTIYGVPRYLLSWLSSLEQVALFSMAFGFAGIASLFQGVITTVWTPWFFKKIEHGLKKESFESLISVACYTLCGVVFLTGFFSNFITFIIPEQYSGIESVIVLSVFFPILFTLSEMTVVGCHVTNNTKFIMISSTVAALSCIAVAFALTPSIGALGAAASMLVSGLILFILRTEFSRRVWIKFTRTNIYTVIFFTCVVSLISIFLNDKSLRIIYWSVLNFSYFVHLAKIKHFETVRKFLKSKLC